ncbi:unnamed protein product [marine sediment metagenome]|uniref:TRASH domain-containing protein n=1 Tax=marine sediment metagenome TaxID=412755 RepID=X1PLP5_9ZZZZ
MSKREYIEKIPAKEIKHKLIICDNPNCESVIIDNGYLITEGHLQTGSLKGELLDFCDEKCLKKYKKLTERIKDE